MNNEEFMDILNTRLGKIREVLGEKAKEYVRNNDRLHNFNLGSQLSGEIREKVLWDGYALKHLVSVYDIIDDMENGYIPTKEHVDEKVGDLINYLILLEACIEQTRKEEEAQTCENSR